LGLDGNALVVEAMDYWLEQEESFLSVVLVVQLEEVAARKKHRESSVI
jgi:hypothetical protein